MLTGALTAVFVDTGGFVDGWAAGVLGVAEEVGVGVDVGSETGVDG